MKSNLKHIINVVVTTPCQDVISASCNAGEVNLLSFISYISIEEGTGQLYTLEWCTYKFT